MNLCRYKKGILSVMWLAVLVSLIVNISSSLLLSKNIDLTGTLLGKFLSDPWIAATLVLFLVIVTVIFGLACPMLEQRSKQYSELQLVSPEEAMQNRKRLLPLLQTIYTQQLLPLQRATHINLELKQRFDMTSQHLKLIWLTPDHVEQPIAPDTPITDIYRQAGNGLLILGAAGAGKSTLLVDLAQELLQQAQQNQNMPFPVVLNLSTWANTQQPLEQWLAEELLLQYRVPRRLTATWINTDQLFPLLDGLDEVKDTARATCIEAINHYNQRHLLPLAVCCRSEIYPIQERRLALQSAIEIQPLDPQVVMNYFSTTPSGKTINTILRQDKVLQELLTTPLMVQIMLLAYQGKSAKDLPRRGSREEHQHYLFESYVQQMLSFQATQQKPMPVNTLSWLSWLARQLVQHTQSDFYLERLNVSWLPLKHPWMYRLGIGILFGLLGGLVGGLLFGLAFGLLGGLLFGLSTGQLDEHARAIPSQGILRSGQNALRVGLYSGLLGGLLGGLYGGLFFGLLVGLFDGLIFGGIVYINHYILRYLLSLLGYLPWEYEHFLDAAAECILLQKVGGGYRFIHQELLRYFASLDMTALNNKEKSK